MEPEAAFQILGLLPTASKDEIKEAYERLAKELHPDTNGDNDRMARVNVARDFAMQHADAPRSLEPRPSSDLAQRSEADIVLRPSYLEHTRSIEKLVRSHKMSPYHQLRFISVVSAVLAAGATFLATQYGSGALPLIAGLAPLTVGLTAIALISSWRLSVLDAAISTLSAELREKNLMVTLLREMADTARWLGEEGRQIPGSFRGEELRRRLDELMRTMFAAPGPIADRTRRLARLVKKSLHLPLRPYYGGRHYFGDVPQGIARLIRLLGNEDSARLILAIGLETGILDELEIADDLGYPITMYRVRKARLTSGEIDSAQ